MNDASAATFENSRDRHLFGPGPKRVLALDGGGVRGALTIAFLERIEALLSERDGKEIRLGDYFDLIGGTSTGAVIAGALALGYRTAQVKDFYLKLAPFAFKRQRWRVPLLQAKFDARGLRHQIEEVVGDRVLQSTDLITGYCIITKRMDTGSPWIISNNPRAPYWESKTGDIGNKDYPLVNLVRASTAAPHFFDPELLPISENKTMLPDAVAKPLNVPWPARAVQALLRRLGVGPHVKIDSGTYGLFVDGGVTPHNNPSVMLFLMAILEAYKIRWTANPENLTIVSIGTGTHRGRVVPEELGMAWMLQMTYHALMSLMSDIQTFALTQMQYFGECLTPWWINSELGALEKERPPNGKMFRFMRYDVQLELPWIEKELGAEAETVLGRKLTQTDVTRWRSMDDPTIIEEIYKLAQIAAKKQVKAEHWLGDMSSWCNGRRPSAQTRTMLPREPEPLPAGYVIWQAIAKRASYVRSWLVRRVPGPPSSPKE